MPYLLRSGSLANYVEVARSVGLNPYQQLDDVGLIRYALLDTEFRLPVEAVSHLLEASAVSSGQIDFGLRIAESRQLADLGPLGFAMWEAPTLRKAVDAMARYLPLHNEALAIHIEELNGLATIRAELLDGTAGRLRQSIELAVGAIHRTLHCFLDRLHGSALVPRRICFRHAAPANTATHTRVFGNPVSFNQEFDGVVYRAADLEAPLNVHAPAPFPQVRWHLDTMLAQTANSTAGNVRRLILNMLPHGKCSIDQVAQQLGIDRRTVHRKLKRSGESYSTILNAVREDLVTRYIVNPQRPLSEVVALVGFASQSAFSRWFAARFGCSVSEWRVRRAEAGLTVSGC